MFSSASQAAVGAKTIVVSLETTSVEKRKEPPQSSKPSMEDRGGDLFSRSKDSWSYYVFCRELGRIIERGRERAVRVGHTAFLL